MNISISIKNGGLKQNRELSGLSQKELADRSGVNLRTIQQYEQGNRDLNSAKPLTILKLCNTLRCSLSALLTDPETLSELEKYMARENDDFGEESMSSSDIMEKIKNLEKIANKLAK